MEPIDIIGGSIAVAVLVVLLVYAKLTAGKDTRSRWRKERDWKRSEKKDEADADKKK